MLSALSDLSDVGTQVIRASEENTIRSLNSLAPVLTQLAKSGDDFVDSLQIILTFPFIDGVVGKNAQEARNLHMGDYTNLSVDLELDVKNRSGTALVSQGGPRSGPLCDELPNPQLGQECRNAAGTSSRSPRTSSTSSRASPAVAAVVVVVVTTAASSTGPLWTPRWG